MEFAQELDRVLPQDVPHRGALVSLAARHLQLIVEANEHMNLTRIVNPREAAVKHVLDSIWPWRFFAGARSIVDAGTGSGLPGIPLSIVIPEARCTLAESIGKKARFVDSAIDALELPNVRVFSGRAEDFVHKAAVDIITARALAPLDRIIPLFRFAMKRGTRLLLYKGPDVQAEVVTAARYRCKVAVLDRYQLPDDLGERTLLEVRA